MTKKRSSPQKSRIFKHIAREIIRDGLNAVDPRTLILDQINYRPHSLTIQGKIFNLSQYKNIHIIGAGKAAFGQYRGLKKVLGKQIHGGLLILPEICSQTDSRIRCMAANHPIPGRESFRAGKAVIDYIHNRVTPEDLVLTLISGGASSLLAYPGTGIEKNDKTTLIRALINSPASIREINCVRKHLSSLKGGRLAEMIYPAKVISLILSDIVNSPLEDIGSGPTIGDATTFSQACHIIQRHRLSQYVNPRLKSYLSRGMAGKIPETVSPGIKKFSQNHHFLTGDINTLLMAAKESAEKRGIKCHVLTSGDHGEAREIAKMISAIIKEIIRRQQPFNPPVLLLAGGELTVSLRGKGQGGRNQEFVLQMLNDMQKVTGPFFVLSMGTDGTDGPTDAAGAWIDHNTMKKVKKHQLDIESHLDSNDSYSFFKQINQLLITGPTGTNVMDFRMFYIP